MKRIAALYTCFNRKDKTRSALVSLKAASENYMKTGDLEMDIYLTDDGSTDGTADMVKTLDPNIRVVQGTGSLFWAEGMRWAWKEALKGNYDGYLLLNDDTTVFIELFFELFNAHSYCKSELKKEGIYVGATRNNNGDLTYSGSIILNKFLATQRRLAPNGTFQVCDLGNANIMMVPRAVVDKIGILSPGYAHGKADYDYTLMAKRKNIPTLVSSIYLGQCENDHVDFYKDFSRISIAERKKVLYKPTAIDFASQLKFNRKFFPLRYPFVWFFGYFKVYFPRIYAFLLGIRKKKVS